MNNKSFLRLSKKITIRQSKWNFRSLMLRLLIGLLILSLCLWVLLQLNRLFITPLISWTLTRNQGHMNFSIAFSNVQRQYSVRKPAENPCPGKTTMLVLIMSRRESFWKRSGIRTSWDRDASAEGVVVRFVVGAKTADGKESGDVDDKLKAEQDRHGDLIRYDIPDGYDNLHFKMAVAFQWQQAFCPNAEFVMKTDDDTVVDLPRWHFWTEHKFRKDLALNGAAFFGLVLENTSPIRDPHHRWFVPAAHFPGNRFPRYMQGATYFGTSEAVGRVMAHTKEAIGYNMDDIIFTGTLADLANVTRFDYKLTHFRGGEPILPNEKCERGVPLVFAVFRNFEKVEEYAKTYEQLHSLKCP